MKTLYFDLGMGAAGDMLTSSLIDLLPNPEEFAEKLNSVGIPGVRFAIEHVSKCGVEGIHTSVFVNGEEEWAHGHEGHHHGDHHHGSMDDIVHLVRNHMNVSEKIKDQVLDVYRLIADAESKVHGVPVTDVHFHEVGRMDAIADVTAFCMLVDHLGAQEIIASPVRVGFGQVVCAHGVLPVPAPATAELLTGVPAYAGDVKGELCTPTGAALIKYFVTKFENMPPMAAEKIGYGMGTKNFKAINCVRAVIGEAKFGASGIAHLSFNVDDMTAEEIGFATEMLFDAGAAEVFTTPVGMKKNRPGTLITVLCREELKGKIIEAAFLHTTTIGIRETPVRRYVLERETVSADTEFGTMRRKYSRGFGIERSKLEYDDVARIARDEGVSLRDAEKLVKDAF